MSRTQRVFLLFQFSCTVRLVLPVPVDFPVPMSSPSCHALAILSKLVCPDWSVTLTYPDWPVSTVLVPMSCPGCTVLAVLPQLSCLGCPVPTVLSCSGHHVVSFLLRLFFLDCSLQLSCPGYPGPAVLSQHTCPNFSCPHSPVPAVLFWLSCLSVPSRLSCLGFPVLAVMYLLSCSGRSVSLFSLEWLVQADLSQMASSDYPVPDLLTSPVVLPQFSPLCPLLVVLSRLSCPISSVLAVMFWPASPLCNVQADLFRLSCPGCHTLAVLPRLSWIRCPVLPFLSRHILAILSMLICQANLSRLICQANLSRLICPDCPVPDALSLLYCHGSLATVFLSQLSCLVMFWPSCCLFPMPQLSFPDYPLTAVLSRPAVLSRLSCPSNLSCEKMMTLWSEMKT